MKINLLRQKILDLAIRGKLVPQDPNDEPASVLLERIRAEKERLIAEGKIKRPKKSKASSPESHYQKFEIPNTWKWTTLEELIILISGQDFPSDKYSSTPKGVPYIIGASNIQNGNVVVTRWTESPTVLSEKNDLLIVCKGAGVGKMGINQIGTSHIARQIQALRPFSRYVSLEYIRVALMNGIEIICSQANGLIPGLPRDLLLKFPIPLPPLAEQMKIVNRIASVLDNINALEMEARAAQDYISLLKSKILDLAMQGRLVLQDPADEPAADMLLRINPEARIITDNPHYPQLPSGWCFAAIRDVFDINPKNVADGNTEAAFVPMASICEGFNNSFVYTRRKWDEIKTGFTHFANGDIAVAKISPCLENRKSMILKNLPNGIGSGTTELLVFRSKVVCPEYGLLFFKSDYFIKQCVGTFNGVVGQQRVGKSIVEEILIPMPPLNMQRTLVSQINELFDILDNILVNLSN